MQHNFSNPFSKNITLPIPFDYKNKAKKRHSQQINQMKEVFPLTMIKSTKRVGRSARIESLPLTPKESTLYDKNPKDNNRDNHFLRTVNIPFNFSFEKNNGNKNTYSKVLKIANGEIIKKENHANFNNILKLKIHKKSKSTSNSKYFKNNFELDSEKDIFLDSYFNGSINTLSTNKMSLDNLKETIIGSSEITLKDNYQKNIQNETLQKKKKKSLNLIEQDEATTIKRRPQRRKLRRIQRSKSSRTNRNIDNLKKYFHDLPSNQKFERDEIIDIINQYL
jgi:hypothetical protein